MYVGPHTDCSPYLNLDDNILQPYREAVELRGDGVVGAAILNNAVIFSEDGEYITEDFEIEIPRDTKRCLVFGLKAGKWISSDGSEYIVSEGEAMAQISVSDASTLKMKLL